MGMEKRLFDTLGKRVRILRMDLGLRQTDIVRELSRQGVDIGQSYMSVIEGTDRIPSGQVVKALAELLGTSTDYLLMLTEDPNPPVSIDEEEVDGRVDVLMDPGSAYLTSERVAEFVDVFTSLPEEAQTHLLSIAKMLRNAETPRIVGGE